MKNPFAAFVVITTLTIVAVACTAKREAAFADLGEKDVSCVLGKASELEKQALTAIEECGISTATSSIQDLIDLFTGAQIRTKCASAADGGPACSSVVAVDAGH